MKVLDAILDILLSTLAVILAIAAIPLGIAAAALLMLAMMTNALTSNFDESESNP